MKAGRLDFRCVKTAQECSSLHIFRGIV